MPYYEYKNNCGVVIGIFKNMNEDIPAKLVKDNETYYRVWGNNSTLIPEHMKAGAVSDPIKYDRGGRVKDGSKIYY
ncbi:MAG: hypothetical protein GF311_28450 [Candidatus Lokiarchaeota archaeon]|nr:hypothetical protein [Candidatus Lokiarchaeota archaeon]